MTHLWRSQQTQNAPLNFMFWKAVTRNRWIAQCKGNITTDNYNLSRMYSQRWMLWWRSRTCWPHDRERRHPWCTECARQCIVCVELVQNAGIKIGTHMSKLQTIRYNECLFVAFWDCGYSKKVLRLWLCHRKSTGTQANRQKIRHTFLAPKPHQQHNIHLTFIFAPVFARGLYDAAFVYLDVTSTTHMSSSKNVAR